MCLSTRRGLYTPNSSGLGEVDMSGRSMSIYTRTSHTIFFFALTSGMTKNFGGKESTRRKHYKMGNRLECALWHRSMAHWKMDMKR